MRRDESRGDTLLHLTRFIERDNLPTRLFGPIARDVLDDNLTHRANNQ